MGKISSDTDKVLLISLPSKDVGSTNVLDFVVRSGFDYVKMEEALVGIKSYTVPSSLSATTYNVLTVTHGLGYTPMSQTFMQDIDDVTATQFAILPYAEASGFVGNYFIAYTTSTQYKIDLVIDWDGSEWAGHAFKFKYQIWLND